MKNLILLFLLILSIPSVFATQVELQEWFKGDVTVSGVKVSSTIHLNIVINDLDAYLANPVHEAPVTGEVKIGLRNFSIFEGTTRFFAPTNVKKDKVFSYYFVMKDNYGQPFTLFGTKYASNNPGFDLWEDTTLMSFQLFDGLFHPDEKPYVAAIFRGDIVISPTAFIKSVLAMKTPGATTLERLDAKRKLMKFFFGNIRTIYGL